jgi:hypothetical protein
MDLDGNIVGLGHENYDVQAPDIGYVEQDIELYGRPLQEQ